MVTPDGRIRRVGPDDPSGLFRATRGGGRPAGVITAVEVAVRSASIRTVGVVTGSGPELATAWLAAAGGWPEALSTALEVVGTPAAWTATVHAWHLGAAADAAGLLADLPGASRLAESALDPLGDLTGRSAGGPAHPAWFGPELRLDQLLARLDPSGQVVAVHLGGALGRPARWADARPGRSATFAVLPRPGAPRPGP